MEKLIINFLKANDDTFCKFVDKWYHGDYNDLSFKFEYDADGFRCTLITEWEDNVEPYQTTVLLIDLFVTLVDKIESSSLDIYK